MKVWLTNDRYSEGNLFLFIDIADKLIKQDLSYDVSLSGQPGAWVLKKFFSYMHAITKLKQSPHIEIENDYRTSFFFMIAFLVYE